ncbi:LysR family transcriptional regulator [Paracoccus seriniphilus]|uniref:Transcriptional regulator, LysR family n=1 Tax=Paracoccus seriniphilus TaxID=184748 RepID=A0A239PVC7_9RHOB|nr:LysR family transcriptional regulator [Paracoccus seriniphilus]WCR16484.1 LysR family transcriptional regulator [Paracoccus seriniphilus]SNT73647.1 transcriptional regulator, LysR family [Paracoccus seriniphilus]
MSNRVGLRQLRAFHAVMMGGSLTAASERLNLSQPTISKQLTALENALQIKLFDRRSGTPVSPTPNGVEFFKAIEATISGLDNLGAIARDIAGHGRRRIRIAATPPVLNSLPFTSGLSRFTLKNPDIQIALEARSRVEIEDWAARQEIDLAFALLPSSNSALLAEPLLDTRAVAVMHRDHPLAGKPMISPADLTGQRLILPSRQLLRSRIDTILEREGHQIAADIESSSANTCCRLALAGAGVAICDPFSPTAYPTEDLVVRNWEPAVRLTYGVIRHKGSEQEPTTQSLLAIMRCALGNFALPLSG